MMWILPGMGVHALALRGGASSTGAAVAGAATGAAMVAGAIAGWVHDRASAS
jgi:hypothetical protein